MRRALFIALLSVQVLAGCLPGLRGADPVAAPLAAPEAIAVTTLDAPGAGGPQALTPDIAAGGLTGDTPPDPAANAAAGAAQAVPQGAQAAPPGPGDAPEGGQDVPPAAETPAAAAPPKSPAELACERRGGQFAAAGTSGARACVQRTRDGGQQCRRQSDCEGQCLARSNTCAPVTPLFGCHEILQADGRRVTLCID